ncbi:GNAT family N-acetyltransferase [Streptomyces sp. NPDC020096]
MNKEPRLAAGAPRDGAVNARAWNRIALDDPKLRPFLRAPTEDGQAHYTLPPKDRHLWHSSSWALPRSPTPSRRPPSPANRACRFIRSPNSLATQPRSSHSAWRADNSALVGSFCLTKLSQGVYELGYWATKEQRGREYSTEAARALRDWGFTALKTHRIEWWAMSSTGPVTLRIAIRHRRVGE